jgi:hypothetical protein
VRDQVVRNRWAIIVRGFLFFFWTDRHCIIVFLFSRFTVVYAVFLLCSLIMPCCATTLIFTRI